MIPRPWVVVVAAVSLVVCLLSGRVSAFRSNTALDDELDHTSSALTAPEDTCPGVRSFPASPSDVYISALVGVHGEGRCGLVDPAGVQVMKAARWTALKMVQTGFIPGVTLGVNIYNTCGRDSTRAALLRAGVWAVVDGGYLDGPTCSPFPSVPVVIVSSNPVPPKLAGFMRDARVRWLEVAQTNLKPQLEAVMPLLHALNWASVAVVAPSMQVLREFGHLAATTRICISAEALLNSSSGQPEYTSVLESVSDVGGVVVVGPQHLLHALLAAAHAHNETRPHWLLVPTGPIQEKVFQGLDEVARGLVAVRRASQSVPEFGEHFLSVASSNSTLYPFVNPEEYVEEPAVFKMVEAVFRVGDGVRRAVVEQCGGSGWCKDATIKLSPHRRDGQDVIEALAIVSQRPQYHILRLIPAEGGKLTFTQVGHFTAGALNLTAGLLEGPNPPPQFPCLSCRCLNVSFAFLSALRWRSEAWVTIFATLAIIGFLLIKSIAIFILVQCSRGRTSEGSQGFSLLLLLGCILLYVAILPFSFEASGITCKLRPFVASLAYAFVFAVMLSRSLMLATSDSDGLLGHVSGIVQTALFFFMVCVQVGLGVQEWLRMSSQPFPSLLQPVGGVLYSCSSHPLQFLFTNAYVMFLLMSQFFISPFVVSSRRNYHEGLLFLIATVLIAAIWVAWITLYIKLPSVWSEACVCLGLAATSTCILLAVFVPKTYLMVTATARESTNVRPLSRPLSRSHSAHELARASSPILYDSIRHIPEMIDSPQDAYMADPTVHLPPRKENIYEAYCHYQPSPHKITRF